MKSIILPLAMIVLGVTIGWLSAPDAPSPAEEESTRLSPRHARDRARSTSHAVPPDIAEKLRPIHMARNPTERLRAVIHLARTLPVSEMARWYDSKWLTLQDGGDLNVFYEITRNRWIAEDPVGILNQARLKNWSSLGEITGRIARTNPDTALEYLETIRNPTERRSLLGYMAAGLAENRPEALLHLASTQFDPDQGTYAWQSAFRAMARSHPGLLENADIPAGLRDLARSSLASTRMETNFAGELSRLLDSPDGLKDLTNMMQDYELSKKFSASLLKHLGQLPADWLDHLADRSHYLAQEDPAAWIATDFEALGMSPANAINVRHQAWQHLSTSDPLKFFELLNSRENANESIPESTNITANALRALTWKNAEEAQQWLDYYLARTDDENARKALQDAVSKANTSDKLNPESLRERLKDTNNDAGQLSNLPYDLSNAGPQVMQEFRISVTNMTSEEQAKFASIYSEHHLSRFPIDIQANLIEAMIQHPPAETSKNLDQQILTQASHLATSWGTEDPVAASRWVTQLPAGEPRQWALRNLATSWMPYEPAAAEAWLKKLPAADQTDVRQFLESNGNGNR